MASSLDHKCHARGCGRGPGQEIDKQPSQSWCIAAGAAIEAVAHREARRGG